MPYSDIWAPVDNVAEAVRYIQERYGDPVQRSPWEQLFDSDPVRLLRSVALLLPALLASIVALFLVLGVR